ncbi:MAG TPA: ribonuclease G [Gammaproteobacteria bacterium]|nr:ribonuclease G [Gammaproteobacteria bacterium]
MSHEILINVTPREVRVALLENGVLQEIHIERSLRQGVLGNIYKGKINRLLPGIQAAFVDIGLERSAFLHISDLRDYQNLASQSSDSPIDIRDVLQVGQELWVQVYKDPLGSKGARLTTLFTIPSRYLVLTPGIFEMTVSQKISDEAERQRLLDLTTPGEQGGYIFRTAAEGVDRAELMIDKEFLTALWTDISIRAEKAKAGDLIYTEIPIILRVLRDLAGHDIERILIDHAPSMQDMKNFSGTYAPAFAEKIEYYAEKRPIFDIYSVEDELQKALSRKVHLKSGGHLIFDQTEAMITIDVNTGSYLGHANLEQTIFKTNLEAVEVIARQVRLRNLGGIIIIDFIDMVDPNHKAHLIASLRAALAKDHVRVEVSELTSLGLVQMTRKRTRESLEHVLCVSCPLCQRRGSIKSYATVCYEIFRELKRVAENYQWPGFWIIAEKGTVNFLLEEESSMLADVEAQLGKPVKLQVEPSYTQEQYDILPLETKIF